jgi:tRNA-modifying protein YgfZ
MKTEQELIGYQQAWRAAAYYLDSEAGSLIIGGKDRESFIQRQTTNDIRHLKTGSALLTVLTSPTARILDVLYLLPEGDQLRALTLPGNGESTTRFLKSRIFFMDQVVVQDTSAELAQISLVGPATPQLFEEAFSTPFPSIDQVVDFQKGGFPIRFFAARPAILPGGRLVAPLEAVQELRARLEEAGARSLSLKAWEVLRIEWGLPGPQAELSEAYTPLEVGLREAISDSKGCYTGQEILARQITYDKITQHLSGLRLNTMVAPGAQIRAEGKRAGVLSSSVESPRYGPLGLAVLKRPYHELGTALELETADGNLIPAQVVQLPFE